MDDNTSPAQPNKKLSREQKVGFSLLLVFAFLAVGLGVINIRNTMYRPFQLGSAVPTEISSDVNTVDALKYRDTDNDGLSDFEELYVYKSSPYLTDTDSDGISDKDEILRGEDPTCPHGKYCTSQVSGADSTGVSSGTISYTNLGNLASDYDFTQDLRSAQESFFSQLKNNPQAVRQLLLKQGMSADDVSAVSDEDLMNLVNKAIQENNGAINGSSTISLLTGVATVTTTAKQPSTNTAAQSAVTNITIPPELIAELSDPTKARSLLVKQGFDEATVKRMTDAQVAQTIEEILNQIQSAANGTVTTQ